MEFLYENYSERWMRSGCVYLNQPSISADMTSLDFYLWDIEKEIIFSTTRPNMIDHVNQVCVVISKETWLSTVSVTFKFCVQANGGNSKHLLKTKCRV